MSSDIQNRLPVDYRELLIKYIRHVGESEGSTVMLRLNDDGTVEWGSAEAVFSPEEVAALRECNAAVLADDTPRPAV